MNITNSLFLNKQRDDKLSRMDNRRRDKIPAHSVINNSVHSFFRMVWETKLLRLLLIIGDIQSISIETPSAYITTPKVNVSRKMLASTLYHTDISTIRNLDPLLIRPDLF